MSWRKRKHSNPNPKPVWAAPLQGPFPAGSPGDQFDVLLTAPGEKKIQVIKVIREFTGCGLKESKDLVDASACGPVPLTAGLPLSAANQLAAALTQAGAIAAVTVPPATESSAVDWP